MEAHHPNYHSCGQPVRYCALEKHRDDDDNYRKRIARDLSGPPTLIADEEAINQIYEELTSVSVGGTRSRGVVAWPSIH